MDRLKRNPAVRWSEKLGILPRTLAARGKHASHHAKAAQGSKCSANYKDEVGGPENARSGIVTAGARYGAAEKPTENKARHAEM